MNNAPPNTPAERRDSGVPPLAPGSRVFHIMDDYDRDSRKKYEPLDIPWVMIAPHEAQAQKNHDQSLATLNRRGGLSRCEACAVIEDRAWRGMPVKEADEKLAAHVAAYHANNQVCERGDEPRSHQ